MWLLDSIEVLWGNNILAWVCDHEMSKLIIKTLQHCGKKAIWVGNLKFGRTHPVLDELPILLSLWDETFQQYDYEDCSVRLKITAINMNRSCQISTNPAGTVFTPTALQAIWAWSRTMAPSGSVLFNSPANQLPPPPGSPGLLLVLLFSFVLRHCRSSNCHWHELSPVHRGLFPLWPVFTFHSNFIWAKQLKGWYPNHILVSFSTSGLETYNLIAGKSIKLSQGGSWLHHPNDVNYKPLTAWLVNKSWTVQQLNNYQSICTIHQMYKYKYIIIHIIWLNCRWVVGFIVTQSCLSLIQH